MTPVVVKLISQVLEEPFVWNDRPRMVLEIYSKPRDDSTQGQTFVKRANCGAPDTCQSARRTKLHHIFGGKKFLRLR